MQAIFLLLVIYKCFSRCRHTPDVDNFERKQPRQATSLSDSLLISSSESYTLYHFIRPRYAQNSNQTTQNDKIVHVFYETFVNVRHSSKPEFFLNLRCLNPKFLKSSFFFLRSFPLIFFSFSNILTFRVSRL